MITIGTVLYKNQGDPPWGTCYSPEWVDKLYRGVWRNYSRMFKFVCLVDRGDYKFEEDIEQELLINPKWPIAFLQAHTIKADRLVLMGLDTIIVGNLDKIFAYEGDLAVPRDVYHPSRPTNSVVLGTTRYDIARSGATNDMRALDGFRYDWLDDLFPGQILSYKVGIRDRGLAALPNDARIVYFHGVPKPHELDEPWVKEHWR